MVNTSGEHRPSGSQAVYPVRRTSLRSPRRSGDAERPRSRAQHRAMPRDQLTRHGVQCSASTATEPGAAHAPAGFWPQVRCCRDGHAARGIDVEASHVVNFDVPHVPEDCIHRVSRTARAELKGDAFTFVAPDEEADLRQIERAIGKRLPRVTVPDFDYSTRPVERFEVPIAERIAAIRARKAEERKRAKEKADRRAIHEAGMAGRRGPGGPPGPRPGQPVSSRHGAPGRPQPHGPRRDGHVQEPARPGPHRPPQSGASPALRGRDHVPDREDRDGREHGHVRGRAISPLGRRRDLCRFLAPLAARAFASRRRMRAGSPWIRIS